MSEIFHAKAADVPCEHKNDYDGYEFFRRTLIPKGLAKGCNVALYEIPPGKSAHPYHYHMKNEESFYIISGKGIPSHDMSFITYKLSSIRLRNISK